jgi:phosphatidylglycerophosphate synthase
VCAYFADKSSIWAGVLTSRKMVIVFFHSWMSHEKKVMPSSLVKNLPACVCVCVCVCQVNGISALKYFTTTKVSRHTISSHVLLISQEDAVLLSLGLVAVGSMPQQLLAHNEVGELLVGGLLELSPEELDEALDQAALVPDC